MKYSVAIFFLLFSVSLIAQTKDKSGFTTLPSSLKYKIVTDAKNPKAKVGDVIKLDYQFCNSKDSTIISTRDKGMSAQQFNVAAKQFNGDVMEGFAMLGKGDSAVFMMLTDSLYRQGMPPFAKSGEYMILKVHVVDVMSQEEYQQQQQMEANSRNAAEEAAIQKYISDNKLTATKTASGLYYVVNDKGTGAAAVAGKQVTVNYTGSLLDGTTFDSNMDPKFQHVEPFTFGLGQGQVIKGWDEGIALFNVGGKGKLIIPSSLGYGSQAAGSIPPNSILIFDIELVDVK